MVANRRELYDKLVVYWADDDAVWVGHSLRTDQIGVGDSPVEALADAIKAVLQVKELADEDETIALFRDAPADIQRMAEEAQPLPKELYEVAHWMATGRWPEHWRGPVPDRPARSIRYSVEADADELVGA